jgi:uncharacterized protein (TIGR03067 family)
MHVQLFGIAMAGTLLLAADAPDDAAKKDLDKLQGTWTVVAMETEGKKLPEEAYKGVKIIVEKNKMTMGKDGKSDAATIVLDPSKEPKWIDATGKEGETLLGIYQLDGDDLKIVLSKKEGDRPKAFATKADQDYGLFMLKRQK